MRRSTRIVSALIFANLVAIFAQASPQQRSGDSARSDSSSAPVSAQDAGKSSAASVRNKLQLAEEYGKLPLAFVANQGQADRRVQFISRGNGYSLFLTGNEAVLALKKGQSPKDAAQELSSREMIRSESGESWVNATLRTKLLGAKSVPCYTGLDELPGKANYFIGNDPSIWRTNVPTYSRVKYEGVYPGVDLVYYGNQGQLEYDFVVAPGADPGSIRLRFSGAEKPRIDAQGDLVLAVYGETVRLQKPEIYQRIEGTKKIVEGRYTLTAANTVGFHLASYDHAIPLVIDPVLLYSSYLGGNQGDSGRGIAVDAQGNAYIVGSTSSTNFPTQSPFQPSLLGGEDVFVAKLNTSGSALIYSTYLGGNGAFGNLTSSFGIGIAVDFAGNAYVTGSTRARDFPTANAAQPGLGSNQGPNAFATKINASGSALIYSTFLGGTSGDYGNAIAADGQGNAYVTGTTTSSNFPTFNAIQPTLKGQANAFVTKFNPTGSLIYSTFLGGSGDFNEEGRGIVADSAGNAYVTGRTRSSNFPTLNPIQSALAGTQNAFVAQFNPTGSALAFSTYLGGSGTDTGGGIALDQTGNVYVTGSTNSVNFPTVNPIQPTLHGTINNAFVTKINSSGSALVYSTYLGGSYADGAAAIAVDAAGDAFVTGSAGSTDFPTLNAIQPTGGGAYPLGSAFVTEINASGSALVYSTYLGGTNLSASGAGIAVDPAGNAYIAGQTNSSNFPTVNAFQPTNKGLSIPYQAFFAKISPGGFTGSVSPMAVSVTSGGSAVYNISVTSLASFTGDVALSISGLPAGASATFSPATITGANGSSTLTVSTSTNTPTGTYALVLTGVSGTPVYSTTIELAVNTPTGDFTQSISPPAQSVSSVSATSFTVSVAPQFGFASDVALAVSGLPNGATATFSPATVVGGSGSSTLTISTSSATPTGRYVLTVTGTSGTLVHSNAIQLAVNTSAGDFTVSVSPSTQTVSPGFSISFTVNVQPLFGFTGGVTLAVIGLPAGVSATFSPAMPLAGGGSSTLSLISNTMSGPPPPAQTFTLIVTASGGGLVHSASVNLVVTDYRLSVSPGQQTVVAGTSVAYAVTLVPLNGFSGSVSLATSGNLPAGASASFSPPTVSPGSPNSTLNISTSTSTPPGYYSIDVFDSTGGHSTNIFLGVSPPPDFTNSFSNTTASVAEGQSATYGITVTPSNGFTGNVQFSVSGLPPNSTASFSPNPVTGGSGSTTLTISTTNATPVGTTSLVVTATSSSLIHSTNISLQVARFSVGVRPIQQTVSHAEPAKFQGSVTPAPGFSRPVTLGVAGLPANMTINFEPTIVLGGAPGAFTFTISANSKVISGSYPITVTGTSSDGETHGVTINLTVQ